MTTLKVEAHGSPYHIYSAGEKVRGKITLNASTKEEPRCLKVNFQGICKTTVTRPYYVTGNDSSRQTLKAVVPLFDQECILFRGPYKLSPTKHEYAFEFEFPRETSTDWHKTAKWKHYNTLPHALPPSFRCSADDEDGEACVHYSVEATLIRGSFKTELKSSQYLLFGQKGPLPHTVKRVPNPQRMQIEHMDTPQMTRYADLSGRPCTPPTLPKSSGAPFLPTLYVPPVITPGQAIEIGLSLGTKQPGHENTRILGLSIDSLKIELRTNTHIYSGSRLNATQKTIKQLTTCINGTLPGIFIPAGETPIVLTHNFCIDENIDSPPSFRTFTISRTYDIIVSVVLRWRHEVFRFSSAAEIDLLPRSNPPGRGRQVLDQGVVDPLPLYTPRELAPAYEEVVSRPAVGARLPNVV